MFNILVVEDNRDLRELLCDALTGEGYRAYSSSDGNEALTRLEETFFDLIIADIMMPNMDGLQLTEELRRASLPPATTMKRCKAALRWVRTTIWLSLSTSTNCCSA